MIVKLHYTHNVTDQTKQYVEVESPYNPGFVEGSHRLAGKWVPSLKRWRFDRRDEQAVKDLCLSVYGMDGVEKPEVVDAEVDIRGYSGDMPGISGHEDNIFLLGRQLAWRPGRDVPVRLGEGVRILSGDFGHRGGSAKYPKVYDDNGIVTLLVRDVPRSLAEKAVASERGAVRIVGAPSPDVPNAFHQAFE